MLRTAPLYLICTHKIITFHILKLRLKWPQISVVHSKITNEVFELGPVYAPIELNDETSTVPN